MLFLINEQKKKTRLWGKWLCRVFLVQEWVQQPVNVIDITKRIAELMNREKQFDWINLTIHFWSWTGIMNISEAIKVHRWDDVDIKDVSIFN